MKHKDRPKVFSFCNQKGGVGKTTSAINLATGLAQSGRDVLLIDSDPQGNATSGLGIEKSKNISTIYNMLTDQEDINQIILNTEIEGLRLLPSNAELSGAEIELISLPEREFQLKKSLSHLSDEYDYIFIDCPPSLGLLTVNALAASNFVLIPLQCEYYALEGLGQLLETYSLIKKNLNPGLEIGGVILTMADFRTKLTEQVILEVRNYFKEKVFNSIIPRSVRLSEAPSFGKPGIIYDKFSRGAKGYLDAIKEFLERFEKSETSQKEYFETLVKEETSRKEGVEQ